MEKITLYSDGACSGNPGPGGYGAILIFNGNGMITHMSKGFKLTTNNRMELLGVIEPLENLSEKCTVHVITDSQYVANAINQGWLNNWVKKGWKTSSKKPVKNQDLWNRLIHAMNIHSVTMEWVKGHDGHPENEQCDELAVKAREGKDLYTDKGYKDMAESMQNQSRTAPGAPPCVRCGCCCNKAICIYGEADEHGQCWFLIEDDPRYGTYKCAIRDKIMEREEGSSTPMFDHYCTSSVLNTVREEVMRLTNEV